MHSDAHRQSSFGRHLQQVFEKRNAPARQRRNEPWTPRHVLQVGVPREGHEHVGKCEQRNRDQRRRKVQWHVYGPIRLTKGEETSPVYAAAGEPLCRALILYLSGYRCSAPSGGDCTLFGGIAT